MGATKTLKMTAGFILVMNIVTSTVHAIQSCGDAVRSAELAIIGSYNKTEVYRSLFIKTGFSQEAAVRLSTLLSNKTETADASDQAIFRTRLIRYLSDPGVKDSLETYKLNSGWEQFKRSNAYRRIVESEKPIQLNELVKVASDVLSLLPASLKSRIPQKYQLMLKTLKLAPGAMTSPEKLLGLAEPLLQSKLEGFELNPLFKMAVAFIPKEIKDQTAEIVNEAATGVRESLQSFQGPGKDLNTDVGISQIQVLIRDLIIDLDIALTYANANHLVASQRKSEGNLASFQIRVPENHMESSLIFQDLKLGFEESQKNVNGILPIGHSKFHVFVGAQTGRSNLFNAIEAKLLLANLGMPELSVYSPSSTPVVVHVARSLDLNQANEWFGSVFKTIKKRPDQYHVVLVDDLRVSGSVLNQLFASLGQLGNNASFLVSWNQIEPLTDGLVRELDSRAKFYQLEKVSGGVAIESLKSVLGNDDTNSGEILFKFQ